MRLSALLFSDGDGSGGVFEYAGALDAPGKFHGEMTREPIGFDHVSFTVEAMTLFQLRDKLKAAEFEVSDAVDHGTMWSIYFFDPNNIPLEASWDCMEILHAPAIEDDDPLPVADEGAGPQPGHWPEVSCPTPAEEMVALVDDKSECGQAFWSVGSRDRYPILGLR